MPLVEYLECLEAMWWHLSKGIAGTSLLATALSQSVVNLHQLNWTVSDPGSNISVPGGFPSQAHLDLYAAGVITDPYYGLNDFDLRWVADSNWTYSAPLTGLCVSKGKPRIQCPPAG